MEFDIQKIVGLPRKESRAISLVQWGESYACVACIGAGAVLTPLEKDSYNTLDNEQIIYFHAPSHANTHGDASPPTTVNNSPDSSFIHGSPGSRLIRVNRSNCVDVAPVSQLVTVGESNGYQPRLLLYELVSGNFLDEVKDQHHFGVQFAKFSPSGNFLASIGTPQDGYIYVWDVSNRKLALHASNRCISEVNDLAWINDFQFITVGVRHVKIWNIDTGSILNGRNLVLGPHADESFECALPLLLNDQTSFVLGSAKGALYSMPDNKVISAEPKKAVKSLSLAVTPEGKRFLFASTLSHIYVYTEESNNGFSPNSVAKYDTDSAVLLSCNSGAFIANKLVGSHSLTKLTAADTTIANDETFTKSLQDVMLELIPKGLRITSCSSPARLTLCWSGEDSRVVRWPSTVIEVPVQDITVACGVEKSKDGDEIAVGTLSGDLWISGASFHAHNGPITDLDMLDSSICITAGRDRCVQIWTRDPDSSWNLRQTILFSTPLLKVRLLKNEAGALALVCCGANRTVYISETSSVNYSATENTPLFSSSQRSFLLKGMPLDMVSYDKLLAIATNDKMVSIIDPWCDPFVVSSWRPTNSNGDTLNLSHIQIIEEDNTLYLLGAANNKSLLLFTLHRGEAVASQWGNGGIISGVAWSNEEVIITSDVVITSKLCEGTKNLRDATTLAKTPDFGFSSRPILPQVQIPKSPTSPLQRSSSPVRKIFDKPAPRSRNTSPTRSPSPSRSTTQRSPSPPPRILARSPVLERGRTSRASVTQGTALKQPTFAYVPPRASQTVQETSSELAVHTKDARNELILALNRFLKSAVTTETDDDGTLQNLLIAALNKTNAVALIKKHNEMLIDDLNTKLCETVRTQIKKCMSHLSDDER